MQIGKIAGTYEAVNRTSGINEKLKKAEKDATAYQASMSTGAFASFSEKLELEKEYNEMLMTAKVEDEAKYNQMMMDRELSGVKSLGRLTEVAEKYGGVVAFRGVTLVFDSQNNTMCLGNMERGDIISAGVLSNGYGFYFNRENIGDLAKIIDLFSPEDVNKIMAAIATDDMADRMEYEIEEDKATGVQGTGQ